MSETDRLTQLFVGTQRNAIIAWLLVILLGIIPLLGNFFGRYEPMIFSSVAIAVVIAPAIKFRDPTMMPPWYFVGLICLPVLWRATAPEILQASLVPGLAMATVGLVGAVELHRFTSLRLVPWFTIVLTVLFTLAMAGLVAIIRWLADVFLGTEFLLDGRSQDALNDALMFEFSYAAVAGLIAGVVFYLYFKRQQTADVTIGPRVDPSEEPADVRGVLLSERLGISVRRQRQLAGGMQLILVGLTGYGVWENDVGVIVNGAAALAITFLPAILERDYAVPIEPGLVLWITTAVFLHTLGSWGLYGLIPPWDHLTHTLSATVIAAAGYATIRAIHLHSPSIHLPRWALFSFTLIFVLALGVVWELMEFAIDQVALVFGVEPVLAQHGLDDTMRDMIFNSIGGLIVATWGTVYLAEVSSGLAAVLERRLPVQ